MAVFPNHVTIDCGDPVRLADFWTAALAYRLTDSGDGWATLAHREGIGIGLFLQQVPEPKMVKNRVHLDLAADGPVDREVERLTVLGASTLEIFEGWTVMQDPEGNEFCVSPGEAS